MYIVMMVYLTFIVGIGVYVKRYVDGVEDFALAGRKMSLPILVGTLSATLVGGATVVGWTGSFYLMGVDWWFSGIGALLGILFATFFSGKFRRLEQFTVPDLLAIRYDNRSRYVSGAMIIIGDIAVITVQILAMTGILVTFIGIDKMIAMILSVIAFTLITFFSGMKGVAITDSIQAILIFGGLIVGVGVLYYKSGTTTIFQSLPPDYLSFFSSKNSLGAFNLFIATFGTTAVSQSVIFSRVFSARDSQTAKKGLLWLIPLAFIGYLCAALLGFAGRAILGSDVAPDQVFAVLVTSVLPIFIGGLLLTVVIAAIVTTTNSILLSASINFTRDFYQQIKKDNVTSKELKRVSQISILIISIISFLLAFLMPGIVAAIVFAYTMYTAGLLVPLYTGYLWKGATATAGMVSIIAGGGTALIWYIFKDPFGLPPLVPSIVISLFIIIVFSQFTKKPSKEQLKVFDY